jgi:DNA polymerase III subunit chi
MAAKAWAKGNRVHIHTQSEESATVLDNLLWTYQDISFVPHEMFDGSTNEETPVTIGYGNNIPGQSQVMINLDSIIPDFASRFERIIEIVGGNEINKQYARQRYRQYKDDNYETHDHKINKLKDHG